MKKELNELKIKYNKLLIEESIQKEKYKRFMKLIDNADILRNRYDSLLQHFRPDIYNRIRFDKKTAKLYIKNTDKKKIKEKNLIINNPKEIISYPGEYIKKKNDPSLQYNVNNFDFELQDEKEEELYPPSPPNYPPPKDINILCGDGDIKDYTDDL